MYESYFGLHSKPFDLLPNPDFLYQSKSHKRAMTYLDYGIKARSGFILITGEIGSGKTTIIRDLIKKKIPNVVLSKIFNTKVSSEQLIAMINDDFGLPVQGKDKITLLRDLNDFLIDQFSRNMQPVLIIDEAQNLSKELLEEVRMLSNLETDRAKLLQIILVGQPELKKILTGPEMLQLRQRININCHIQPLSPPETKEYILHRLERAGDRNAARFSPEALKLIHEQSRGVPRLINIICDFLMLAMFSAETRNVDGDTVREILQELNFQEQFWESEPNHPEQSIGSAPMELSQDFQRTKSKISSLLRDITQRVEFLERNAEQWNSKLLSDVYEERIARMEEIIAQQSQQLEILAEELNQPHTAHRDSPPAEQPHDPQQPPLEPLESTFDLPPQERKGFFRRFFGS